MSSNRGCLSSILVFPFALCKGAIVAIFSVAKGVVGLIVRAIGSLFPSTNMDGHKYERFVADYLSSRGYHGVKVTRGSGDYGVDVIANKRGIKYAVQCKYYTGKVSNKAVQEAVAGKAHYGCNGAMVVTNSTFTEAAKVQAQENGVILLSGIAPRKTKHPVLLGYLIVCGMVVLGAVLSKDYQAALCVAGVGAVPVLVVGLHNKIKEK